MIEETLEGSEKSALAGVATVARRRGIPCAVMFEEKKISMQSVLLLEFTPTSRKAQQTRLSIQELPQRLRAFRHGNF